MIHKKIFKIIALCIATVLSFLPFNLIVGSKFAWFSYSSMAIPALGYHTSLLYVILFVFTKSLFCSSSYYLFVFHRLPLIFSTCALQKRDWKIFVVVPLLAMMLFCVHPVGQQVFYYSWYWFIPMIIYFFMQDTLYSRALASSFIAHAVGSVVWLYVGYVPVQAWTALLPIVAIERIFIAGGMVSCVLLYESIASWYHHKVIA